MGMVQHFPNKHLQQVLSVLCHIFGHCNGGESTSTKKIETFSMPEKDFQMRSVFQVGHHAELP
jgi:hypothetical protein